MDTTQTLVRRSVLIEIVKLFNKISDDLERSIEGKTPAEITESRLSTGEDILRVFDLTVDSVNIECDSGVIPFG